MSDLPEPKIDPPLSQGSLMTGERLSQLKAAFVKHGTLSYVSIEMLFSHIAFLTAPADSEIGELERLEKEATEGPWAVSDENDQGGVRLLHKIRGGPWFDLANDLSPNDAEYLLALRNKAIPALKSLLAKLRIADQWISDLQSGMYINCVYCGHRYGPSDSAPVSMATVLYEHIKICPKHPLSKAESALTLARTEIEGLRALATKYTVAEHWDLSETWRQPKGFICQACDAEAKTVASIEHKETCALRKAVEPGMT